MVLPPPTKYRIIIYDFGDFSYNRYMENEPQIDILKQIYTNLNESDKQSFIDWIHSLSLVVKPATISNDTDSIEEFLKSHKSNACPHCGSSNVIKNGHMNGKQRFVCHDCHTSFGMATSTILHQTKKEVKVWMLYVNCMMQKHSIRKSAKICDISIATAFAWRHKILDALSNMMNEILLSGVVEADETYQLISYKGNHKKSKHFTMPRKSHKRGGHATKRGLSNEHVCITCGVNLDGKSVGRISNLGKPSCKELGSVLDGHVASGSIFVTDHHRGYCKLANDYEVSHIHIPRNKHVASGFNIQMVNYYHSSLKGMINIHFKGVATKYLNNYVVWHNLVNFAKESESEKEVTMRDFVFTTNCLSTWKKNRARESIPCSV